MNNYHRTTVYKEIVVHKSKGKGRKKQQRLHLKPISIVVHIPYMKEEYEE